MDCKTCTKCGESKPLDAFYAEKRAPDGRYARCKVCHSTATRKWREENPGKQAVASEAWRQQNLGRVRAAERLRYAADVPAKREKAIGYYRQNRSTLAAKRAAKTAAIEPFYVANRLRIPVADLTPELLALKRDQLELHRLLRDFKTELNKETT